MIKLNRTTEYGLMALRHMLKRGDTSGVVSAREISDTFSLPFEITAKTLQRLKDTGLIHSAQGARGGYSLDEKWKEMNFGRFLELMEGPQAIVSCHGEVTQCSCEYLGTCELTPALRGINEKFLNFMASIPLDEVVCFQGAADLTSAGGAHGLATHSKTTFVSEDSSIAKGDQ